MVDVTEQEVADALHLSGTSELPTGVSSDIAAAEALVGDTVEPYADDQSRVGKCATYVACAFITGTENDNPVSSISRGEANLSFDTKAAADEAQDYWTRAQTFDPTDRLGRNTISFEVM